MNRIPVAPKPDLEAPRARRVPGPAFGRRPRRLVILAVLVVASVLGVGAGQATAYSRYTVSGRPGAVYANQVAGTHLQVPCGAPGYYNCFAPGLQIPGLLVYRSPATTGAQVAIVYTTVDRWIGSAWYVETQRTQQLTIPAGQSSVRFGTLNVLTTVGLKRVRFGVVWGDAYGRALGSQLVHMVHTGDYTCQTRFTLRCTVYAGYVGIGQP